jgi:hypothetical protein
VSVFDKLPEKLRAGGADNLPPGELFAGPNAAREQRMRGRPEGCIAMMRAHIARVTAEHGARAGRSRSPTAPARPW